jgi:aryl-alcohol dehydrogenase-like predicted oxidoreductase
MPGPEQDDNPARVPTMSRVFILGTAQLGFPYGRNRYGQVPPEDVAYRIFDAAWDKGIRTFDTAENYGVAAHRLASWMASRKITSDACVVSKVGAAEITDSHQIERALSRFEGTKHTTLLSHGFVPVELFARFAAICRMQGVSPGQSVYTGAEVVSAVASGAERIQAPMNVLDRRQLDAARACGSRLDARSIYLQGLLLEAAEAAESRVAGAGRLVTEIWRASARSGLTPATALLAAAHSMLGPDDRIVIGVDAPEHLDDLERALSISRPTVERFVESLEPCRSLTSRHPEILDPRQWN